MNKFISIQDLRPANIEVQFQCRDLKVNDEITVTICILKVKGNYPDGSKGAMVGEYLRGLSVFLREVYNLDSLILDLSDLNYKWGNNLIRAVNPEALITHPNHNTWIGYFVIGSQENKDALTTLFCEFGKSSGIEKIYLSEEDVVRDILSLARKTLL